MIRILVAFAIFLGVGVGAVATLKHHIDPVEPSEIAALAPCEKDRLKYRSQLATAAVTASDIDEAQSYCAQLPAKASREALLAEQQRALNAN